MKVIRKEDKKSSKYIIKFDVEKGTIQKNTRKNVSAVEITTEDYDNLVVYMADGSKPRYANVEENKVRLLELRYQQFKSNREYLTKLQTNKGLFNALLGVGTFFSICISLGTGSLPIILQWSIITIALAYTSATIVNKVINSKINDIKKYALFFENEDIFKDVDLDDANTLERVKSKDKAVIAEIKQEKDKENEKPYLDNNSIDGLSFDTLAKIIDNVKRDDYLGLVSTDEEVKGNTESKGKSYVKK